MVDSMEHSYSMHGHTRSLSSLASTIMAVTSDASPFTSVTASPMESYDADEIPLESKIPLPLSSACSEDNEEKEDITEESVRDSAQAPAIEVKHIHPDRDFRPPEAYRTPTLDVPKPDELPGTAITLKKLAYLLDLEVYQKRRATAAQAEVQGLMLSCGLDKRMISTYTIAYGNMIDQYKTDDQAGFAGLFDACDQLKAFCASASRYSGPGADESARNTGAEVDGDSRSSTHFLSSQEQEDVLTFLTRIRTESNFLSDKISSMSPVELTALTSSYHPAGIDFSVLQNHSHGKLHAFSRDSQMMKLSRRMDNLHRFHNQDPFFALLYGVFDSSACPGSLEHSRRMDIWSSVCAQNMVAGFGGSRPGADELAIATLDSFANFQDWSLKPRMEAYLTKLLVEGSFLLETPVNHIINFQEPMETQHAKAAIAETDFFENALTELFKLLTAENLQQAVPHDVLAFAHAVLRKIEDPKLRLRARQFIVIRWYFATFLSSIIVYPEVCGLLITQHIGETARRLIWQKLVVRMQERVFDVALPWNDDGLVKPEIRDGILTIFDSFEPPSFDKPEVPPVAFGRADEASSRFLMLNILDVVGLVKTLCLDRNPPNDHLGSGGTKSDRPSTAGSSTLVAGSSIFCSAVEPPTIADNATSEDPISSSVIAPPAQGESSHVYPGGQPRATPAKRMEIAKEDVDARLRRTCQKLKDTVPHDGASNPRSSRNIWMFVHYTEDGSKLSMVPGLHDDTATSSPHFEHSGINEDADTIGFLKKQLTSLLYGNEESGQDCPNAWITTGETRLDSGKDPLEGLFEVAMKQAHSALDFDGAHLWWNTLKVYRLYLASKPLKDSSSVLRDLSNYLQTSIETTANVAGEYESQRRSLDKLQNRSKRVLARLEELRNGLRVKMWYVSDVRHSATYEEALYVTRALRSMASLKRPKQVGSIHSWARQRLKGSSIHDRAEAQTLEAMVASRDHGGLSKLADDQVELTSRWLTRESIENFCKGEERIHRFCYEIHRSIGKIAGTSLLDNPVLWSSNLFKRERISFDTQPSRPGALGLPFHPSSTSTSQYRYGNLHSPTISSSHILFQSHAEPKARSPPNSFGGFWSGNHSPRESPGLGLYTNPPNLPPTPTSPPISWSTNTFTPSSSLYTTGAQLSSNSPFSAVHSRGIGEGETLPAKKAFAEQIKKSLCSLLISDLGYLLWNQGSETDAWVNTCLSEEPCEMRNAKARDFATHYKNHDFPARKGSTAGSASGQRSPTMFGLEPKLREITRQEDPAGTFPFAEAYAMLLQRMSFSQDPYVKLQALYELEKLILNSMSSGYSKQPAKSDPNCPRPGDSVCGIRGKSLPRTKATSLEEVIANCTERRAGTLRSKAAKSTLPLFEPAIGPTELDICDTDDIVNALLSIFKDLKLRPSTLFRDLQYIAAFIPSETLDQTAQGKAFWDAGLAALALKEDLCESMISRAITMTAYHISPRTSMDPAADNALASTTLRDAARLWLITAKEGSPVAARELGLFYLTHPELLPRATMPLSKAKDVFKSMASHDSRAGDKERGALDPHTFAVVFHWMEVAANGGDKDAKDFLKGNGELSAGR